MNLAEYKSRVSRDRFIGYVDTHRGVLTYPENATVPIADWVRKIKEIAETQCNDKEYAAGVVDRCNEFFDASKSEIK